MDNTHTILYIIFLVFSGTAVLSTLALYTRQSLLVAYILLGALIGPWGLKLVSDAELIKQTGDIGIIFLLFLLGLNLHPQDLLNSLRKMSPIAIISSSIFLAIGFTVGYLFQYSLVECFIIGLTMMFSSTIIGLKLLPTTVLHHQHTGELMVSILLLQDIIAIGVLLILKAFADQTFVIYDFIKVMTGFPLLLLIAFMVERFVIIKLLRRFDKVHEYIFILSIAWCLCISELALWLGLPEEIGAFVAGVTLATHPVANYIADSLRPLRDFFLVMFFFTIGAGFNFEYLDDVFIPAAILAGLMLFLKPYVFSWLLQRSGESKQIGFEVGVRLGQISEFSLLVIFLALQTRLVSEKTSYMILLATILTFVVSSYWVTLKYPTPLAASDKLRRD